MTHTHNFGQFEIIFRETMDGKFDIQDIHELYILYKEGVVHESATNFLKDWFQGCNYNKDLIYLKTTTT